MYIYCDHKILESIGLNFLEYVNISFGININGNINRTLSSDCSSIEI